MAVCRPLIRSDLASLDVSYRPEEDIEYRLTIIPVFRTGHSQLRTQFYESRFGAKRIEVGVVEIKYEAIKLVDRYTKPINRFVMFAEMGVDQGNSTR